MSEEGNATLEALQKNTPDTTFLGFGGLGGLNSPLAKMEEMAQSIKISGITHPAGGS